ncbi:hypothetical protein ABPG75_009781 [Micractinium tetrahymenae]
MAVPAALQAAGQLTRLTRLSLEGCCNDSGWPEGWPEETSYGAELARSPHFSLAALPQLQRLDLNVDELQPSTCCQLSALTGLKALSIKTFVGQVPAQLWASLARMPALEELSLGVQTLDGEDCIIPGAAWEALAKCKALAFLKLEHVDISYMDDWGDFHLAPGIAGGAPALTRLHIKGNFSSLGDVWQHPGIAWMRLEDPLGRPIPMPPARQVDMPALRELQLYNDCSELASVPPQMACLSAVTSLYLVNIGDELLPQQPLWQLPSLASLSMYCCALNGALPQGVLQLTRLKALNLGANDFSDLPEGPYLGSLGTLVLSGNPLTRLPSTLSSATQLEVLDVSDRYKNTLGLRLELEDVDMLRKLPALRVLCVPDIGANVFLGALFSAWLPHLVTVEADDMCSLFPNGWDARVDEEAYAWWLEEMGRCRTFARCTVMDSLGSLG